MFYNYSCCLPLANLDSDNFQESWLTYHLNQACLSTVFSLKKLLVYINLYELFDYIEVLHIAFSVNNADTPVFACFNLIIY
jgi:hypothetical protein